MPLPARRRRELPLWRAALQEVLEAANKPQSQIADELCVDRAIVNRYLTGQRVPDDTTLQHVNRAVAKILNVPEIEPYLNAVAYQDGALNDDDLSLNDAWKDAVEALTLGVFPYIGAAMEPEYWAVIRDALDRMPQKRLKMLVGNLTVAWRKQNLRLLDGRDPLSDQTRFDQIVTICAKHGLRLDEWRAGDNLGPRAAIERARFESTLRSEIAKLEPDIVKRQSIEARIMAAFCRYVIATPGQHIWESLLLDHYDKRSKSNKSNAEARR